MQDWERVEPRSHHWNGFSHCKCYTSFLGQQTGLACVTVWLLTSEGSQVARSWPWLPYRHDELLHAVRCHAVEVGEVQLEVDLVVEHVLAQGAAEHGLHGVLCHGVHPQAVHIHVAVLAVRTLVHL